jgi:AcrR family transcriptional regulator
VVSKQGCRARPSPLDELWAGHGEPGPVSRQGLTVDRVVQAAIDLADADGIDAVTMSRVGQSLGFTAMALYRHVPSKDVLIALMVDTACEQPEPSRDAYAGGWRTALEEWSHDLLEVVRRHPWVIDLPLSRLPFGPRRLGWLERGLRALEETAIDDPEKAALILVLNNYVFSQARSNVEVGNGDATSAGDFAAQVLGLTDDEHFPTVRRWLSAEASDQSEIEVDPDRDFAFGLERILDGIAVLVASTSPH